MRGSGTARSLLAYARRVAVPPFRSDAFVKRKLPGFANGSHIAGFPGIRVRTRNAPGLGVVTTPAQTYVLHRHPDLAADLAVLVPVGVDVHVRPTALHCAELGGRDCSRPGCGRRAR